MIKGFLLAFPRNFTNDNSMTLLTWWHSATSIFNSWKNIIVLCSHQATSQPRYYRIMNRTEMKRLCLLVRLADWHRYQRILICKVFPWKFHRYNVFVKWFLYNIKIKKKKKKCNYNVHLYIPFYYLPFSQPQPSPFLPVHPVYPFPRDVSFVYFFN